MRLEDLGVIGNCQYSALIDRNGSIVWCCLPRFDAEPVFSTLLDEKGGGVFTVGPAGGEPGVQRYLPNTNILETTFRSSSGSFRVIDFAPRYFQNDRFFRPTMIVRIIEPLEGTPRVRVRCEPRLGWSKGTPGRLVGSNHIRYDGFAAPLRLTTDIPLSYVTDVPFALTGKKHLVLAWGPPLEDSLPAVCEQFLGQTKRYWERWVMHCDIPPLFQQEVIRSALALKLHCFEDTGAIVAAMTTSLPEAPGSGRNWDYRYCWLRDAYYALAAFRLLGHFEEREQFIQYLFNIAASAAPSLSLGPLYRVDGAPDLEEFILDDWPGYEGNRPVRVGNAAATQLQHDVFGEMVLALAPVFLDDRFVAERSQHGLDLLERLAQKAIEVAGTPDAGIWEFRSDAGPQTFSSLMCWCAADRMASVAARHRPERASHYRAAADRIRAEILEKAWRPDLNSFVSSYGGEELDAALLQMAPLRFLPPNDPRLHGTIDAIRERLSHGGWLMRYRGDEFGETSVAFIICTFWLCEALATVGRKSEAREVLERARSALSPLGLLSEDYETRNLRMWGNFPQAYSHVGLIHAAFASSPPWSDIL
ncbi:glycoside hydrolase family 15 protein [Polyangium spumosum]|uniref:Glycoside hydrolase family 15 protein n=1 Tax=Polyangium spumosum TaxID=889282 RepID=A0A6N7PEY3_9BACT|nr:glycoside hydrolase family 15 protein [Polyangium spumosum]